MFERLFALETFGIKLGLDNISRLCAALGHPERTFIPIHIAGTNGKGSVTAMVHAALTAAGIRAGRFTSPHLSRLAERIVVGSEPLSDPALEIVATDVLDCIDRLKTSGELSVSPTFFEATTAIGFEAFRRAGVEVAVVEVGLGGRFDATNVVQATVGAVTSIGFDHQQHLGNSLGAIAFEKAGIIKPGMTVVTGTLPDEAQQVIHQVAAERHATVVSAREGTDVESDVRQGQTLLTVHASARQYGPLVLGLRGDHQIENALVAIRVLETARAHGVHVTHDAVERGLRDVDWPGRLEQFDVDAGQWVFLDAAHNPDGARALAAYLRNECPEPPTLVIGVMRDKDVAGILAALLPVVSSVVATAADTPRALSAPELAASVASIPAGTGIPVRIVDDAQQAVDEALALGRPVCVSGSILLIGAVRDAVRRRVILP